MKVIAGKGKFRKWIGKISGFRKRIQQKGKLAVQTSSMQGAVAPRPARKLVSSEKRQRQVAKHAMAISFRSMGISFIESKVKRSTERFWDYARQSPPYMARMVLKLQTFQQERTSAHKLLTATLALKKRLRPGDSGAFVDGFRREVKKNEARLGKIVNDADKALAKISPEFEKQKKIIERDVRNKRAVNLFFGRFWNFTLTTIQMGHRGGKFWTK